MSGATDTYCLLSQPKAAILNSPTTFQLAVTNTSASTAYTVSSVSVWATNTGGQPVLSARFTVPQFPVNATTDVAASSTLYCMFDGTFFGSAVTVASAAPERALVTAQVTYSDGSTISASALPVSVADPIFGVNAGAGFPPNPDTTIPSCQFYAPANSGYLAVTL
jgi:hypothetical protein